MADDREQKVKSRAYEIWESEGRPSGRHDENWDQARREIERDQGRTTAGPAPEGPAKRAPARRAAGAGASRPAGESKTAKGRSRRGGDG